MTIHRPLNAELIPLKQWYCDKCGEIIDKEEDGWLEWYHEYDDDMVYRSDQGFRIVHHDKRCMYNSRAMHNANKGVSDMHLEDFTGPNGLANLLSSIELEKCKDNKELIEIIKRLHLPYYEEARRYHDKAEMNGFFDGENEVTRSLVENSITVIGRYKD